MELSALVWGLFAGLLQGTIYSLFALGLNMAFGIMKIVNFAHGQFVMLGCYVTYLLCTSYGIDPYLSLLIVIPLFFIIGMALQKSIISRVVGSPMIVSLLVCFSIGIFIENVVILVCTADIKMTPAGNYAQLINVGPFSFSLVRLIGAIFSVILMISLFLFLKLTLFGKAIRAVMQEPIGARLVGISSERIYVVGFGICVMLAGVAGSLMSLIFPFNPFLGYLFMLKAFCICVLGGLGNMIGSILGGIILGLSESLVEYFLGSLLKDAVAFIILILILLIKPRGILGGA